MKARFLFLLPYLVIVFFTSPADLYAQGTAFTYQGRLNSAGTAANGSYDLVYTLYSTNTNGAAVAGPITNSATLVSNGLFISTVDFGDVFTGSNYWLDIAVRTNGSLTFTELTPRQPISPTPYAITAGGVTGTIPLAQLPATLVTNNASGVNLSGTFSGNGAGLTNLAAAIAAVNGAGTNTTLINASLSATNLQINGATPLFGFVQTNNVGGGGIFGGQIQPYTPHFGEAIPGGNTNFNDTLQIACDALLSNNYADLSFGYWVGTPYTSANFQTQGGIGVGSQGGNWNIPFLNQSNWGVYQPGAFVMCAVGGNPIIFAGDILGDPTPGDIPQMFLSHNYTHFFITDQWTGETNYFDFNKTTANFSVPYGTVSAVALADGSGTLPAATNIASLSGANIFTGSNTFKGSVYTAGGYAAAAFVGTVTVTNAPTFNHTNTAPTNSTTPILWMDVTNNGLVYKMPLYQ